MTTSPSRLKWWFTFVPVTVRHVSLTSSRLGSWTWFQSEGSHTGAAAGADGGADAWLGLAGDPPHPNHATTLPSVSAGMMYQPRSRTVGREGMCPLCRTRLT